MVMIDHDIIDEIFMALERQIQTHGGAPIGLVVCGGTALSALGLVNRTTKDVDILGRIVRRENGFGIEDLRMLPEWLEGAANVVQRDFGLPENWLNLGPAAQLQSGLPDGFARRLVRRDYGHYLTIYFISRIDQIHFKLYAAVDRDDYHVQDLFALDPSERELEDAVKWVLTQDVSEGFRLSLKGFLKRSDCGNITDRI